MVSNLKVNLFMEAVGDGEISDAELEKDPTKKVIVAVAPKKPNEVPTATKTDADKPDTPPAEEADSEVFTMSEKEIVYRVIDGLFKLGNIAENVKRVIINSKSTVDNFQEKLANINRIISDTDLKIKITNFENAKESESYIEQKIALLTSYLEKIKSSETKPTV